MNLNPEVWGPAGWTLIHSIAMSYPDNPTDTDKQNMNNFLTSLQSVLPCESCRDNYKRHLKKLPINRALSSREALFRWTVDVHNEVNKMNNKKIMPYDEALDRMMAKYKKKGTRGYRLYLLPILVVLIFIIIKNTRRQ